MTAPTSGGGPFEGQVCYFSDRQDTAGHHYAVLAVHPTGQRATLVYGSSTDYFARNGAAHVVVDPATTAAKQCGLRLRTYFYGSYLVRAKLDQLSAGTRHICEELAGL